VLRVGDQELVPVRVQHPWRPEILLGDRRFVVHDDRVAEVKPLTGGERWSIEAEDGADLRWLTAHGDIAYFAGTGSSVRRLDLNERKWLPALAPSRPVPGGKVRSALVDDRGVAVFVSSVRAPDKLADEEIDKIDADREKPSERYELAYFESGKTEQAWSRNFLLQGAAERPDPAGLLWSATRPDYASSAVQTLCCLGDDLLVCPGELQGLFCLDRAHGQVQWQLQRPWEFERSFIGPSVWNHTITRFGLEHATEKELADSAGKLAEQTEAAIVGGPVVVNVDAEDDEWSTRRIFIAVAKGPKGAWSGYLQDCTIYELNASGQPIAMCKLPRMVLGQTFRSLPGGVVWSMQRGGLVRVTAQETSFRFGPGTDDCLCKIDWYREFRPVERQAWFVAEPLNGVAAFSQTHLFRAVSGGYVEKKAEAIYRFPITEVDLSTGFSRDLELAVPLERQLTLPRTNFRAMKRKNAGQEVEGVKASGTYLLAITRLEVDNDEKLLRVVMGMEDSATSLEFVLPANVNERADPNER
jgi:hypothetical protein